MILLLYINNLYAQSFFSIVIIPDTQYYPLSLFGGNPEMFISQTNWIVENQDLLNIEYVVHLGDITNYGNKIENEWIVADSAISLLEDSIKTKRKYGIPFGLAVGNHDQYPNGSTELFNKYFGTKRFLGREYYGGNYGINNDSHYDVFNVNGVEFIVIYIEYYEGSNLNLINWANSILRENKLKRGIIVSHRIIGPGNNARFDGDWQKNYEILKYNPNLFLLLCGHHVQSGWREDTYNGNTIRTMLTNFQESGNGGDGWLRYLKIFTDKDSVEIHTYSPYLNLNMSDSGIASCFSFYLPTILPPSNLRYHNLNNGIIRLVWDDNSFNETKFQIELKTGLNANFIKIDSVDMNINYYDFINRNGMESTIRIKAVNGNSESKPSNSVLINLITSANNKKDDQTNFLFQNYPNPFNGNTKISYYLSSESTITIKVYDNLGRQITALINEKKMTGLNHCNFDPEDFGISTGVYYCVLSINETNLLKKMVYVK